VDLEGTEPVEQRRKGMMQTADKPPSVQAWWSAHAVGSAGSFAQVNVEQLGFAGQTRIFHTSDLRTQSLWHCAVLIPTAAMKPLILYDLYCSRQVE
jgi:hypothetical protein